MKKIILSSIALFTFTCLLNAQSTKSQAIEKKSTPQKVDKNIKKLEKKTSKAETLMEREQEEKKTEEQAKPNPMKSKVSEKALNPQPFPPADKAPKKLQNVKTITN